MQTPILLGQAQALGYGRKRYFHPSTQRWGDLASQATTKGCNNNNQAPTTSITRADWMTPRTGCDYLEFRTSGNTSWRAMTHQVQM